MTKIECAWEEEVVAAAMQGPLSGVGILCSRMTGLLDGLFTLGSHEIGSRHQR